ncbi:MAG: cupin-like domain-containing protein [Myxococcales bacterium]|nr:cupin-like domain-containing protein [Myxococcales bacterium]
MHSIDQMAPATLTAAPLTAATETATETAPGTSAVVDRVAHLSPKDFAARYFRARRPVLITDMATRWPACERWTFDFFARQDPDRRVTLEKGNVLQGETDFETARIADYLARIESEGSAEGTGSKRRYLSMFRVFEAFPRLKADVDFHLIEKTSLWQIYFAWLGPAGTLTGYHIDWIDNILTQIRGRKRVWLVPPEQSSKMYPSKKYDYRSTLSEVEPNTWDPRLHPRFAEVTPLEITLEPGHMLFIPHGWWHRVLALTPSISINAFAQDLTGLLWRQSRASSLHLLHRAGLYGRADCTCHHKTPTGTDAR